jgi:hypothetical protein
LRQDECFFRDSRCRRFQSKLMVVGLPMCHCCSNNKEPARCRCYKIPLEALFCNCIPLTVGITCVTYVHAYW